MKLLSKVSNGGAIDNEYLLSDTKIKLNYFTYDSTFGSPTFGFTADGGGENGQVVGQHMQNLDGVILGGDFNYDRNSITPDNLRLNFYDKYPNTLVSLVNGNHEHHISRESDEIRFLSENLSSLSNGRFSTHPINNDALPAPFADIVIDENNRNNTLVFLHVDSTILPYSESYANDITDLLIEAQRKYKDKCNIVISLHHAPETYTNGRKDDKDTSKYLKYLTYRNKIDAQRKEEIIKGGKEQLHKSDNNKADLNIWNQIISRHLKKIYATVKDKCGYVRIMATQSGHDHHACIQVQKNHPPSILQGNGSNKISLQYTPKKDNSGSLNQTFIQVGKKKNKLFGIDISNLEANAIHRSLGFGVWYVGQTSIDYVQYIVSCEDREKCIPITKVKFDSKTLNFEIFEANSGIFNNSSSPVYKSEDGSSYLNFPKVPFRYAEKKPLEAESLTL
ncbi:hypothetical protein L3V86_07605 [Thiotrichales bacterium 19S11-10]|nr:hypothetical protein [Thiotrichales bacterium 19S11-10]